MSEGLKGSQAASHTSSNGLTAAIPLSYANIMASTASRRPTWLVACQMVGFLVLQSKGYLWAYFSSSSSAPASPRALLTAMLPSPCSGEPCSDWLMLACNTPELVHAAVVHMREEQLLTDDCGAALALCSRERSRLAHAHIQEHAHRAALQVLLSHAACCGHLQHARPSSSIQSM